MCKSTNKPEVKMDIRENISKESENGFLFDPWHSTPVKKPTEEANKARQPARSPPTPSNHISSLTDLQRSKSAACAIEITTVQKQRMELQLLIAELKDRDQELNTMVAAHHRQLQAWEQDRQRVLTLEQKCTRLEDELQKRNEVIRAISKRLKVMDVREKESQRELSNIQQQLQELSQRQHKNSQERHDLEERNQSLNSTIMSLSSQVGKFHVHEEELSSMLKLKDKDLMEATNHILALTSRLQETDASLQKSQARESKLIRETDEYKRHFREARHDNVQLKDELQEKTLENNDQREELIRLKQENHLLRKELAIAGEGESWKDELLGLARSKQQRTESELLCLRQVCEKQQNDLQLLKLNLESTRETLRQYEGHRSLENSGDVTWLNADCPMPSPRSRRSPAPAEDAAFNSSNQQEEYSSSTSRLQRLLANSLEMVASLERSSGKSLSPTLSPTSHCNSVCSVRINHNNSNNQPLPAPHQ